MSGIDYTNKVININSFVNISAKVSGHRYSTDSEKLKVHVGFKHHAFLDTSWRE